jgi:hypothetical protein
VAAAKSTEAECTAPDSTSDDLHNSHSNLLPDMFATVELASDETQCKSVQSTCPSSPSVYSSASSSSSSSSREVLPKTLEPKRKRYCIGPGVHCLCETLKQVKVGTIEQPGIYFHTRDEEGNITEDLVPVNAIGDEPSPPLLRRDDSKRNKNVRYSSPMVAALDQNRSFEPRDGGDQRQNSWHDRSSYRSEDPQQQQPRQPNYAPFRSVNRRVAAQRAQMQHQHQYNRQTQMPFRSNNAGNAQWHQQQSRGYDQVQPGGCWQRQQYQQPPSYQPMGQQRLPPRASLYGLLPAQGYDMPPPPPPQQPYGMQQQNYERAGPVDYDPAPHQAHWRGNPYEHAEVPLSWEGAATGANATPLGGNNNYPISLDGDGYEPPPPDDIWRRDVDFVKKGILHRTRS